MENADILLVVILTFFILAIIICNMNCNKEKFTPNRQTRSFCENLANNFEVCHRLDEESQLKCQKVFTECMNGRIMTAQQLNIPYYSNLNNFV